MLAACSILLVPLGIFMETLYDLTGSDPKAAYIETLAMITTYALHNPSGRLGRV
jgi:hypothetical protein